MNEGNQWESNHGNGLIKVGELGGDVEENDILKVAKMRREMSVNKIRAPSRRSHP